ncbi:MAG: methyltransferase domain-containing protein, partial [Deltaproteobacteria bacterium]|nr:methyltransferase domain-containing protein [Kofleriaceae bacterium]
RSLLELGSGLGTYTAAFLDAAPGASATLCDFPDVLALARVAMARHGDRVRFVAGDARAVPVGAGHGAVLCANLLHLHDERTCADLCMAAARAVADDGVVVIKDLRVDEDRGAPLEGLLFALNMAVYTAGGDVYPVSRIRAWLAAAGLTEIEERRLAAAPEGFVLFARRTRRGSRTSVPA